MIDAVFGAAMPTLAQDMFHLPIPLTEKIVRPLIVYVALVIFLRLFGKRELAQLNPFDLVVLLSLSNTVQNAIIGDDNSVTGGIVGAFSLLAANWLLTRVLYRSPRLNSALEGSPSVLIRDGQIDRAAVSAEKLTSEELISVLNRNGFNDPGEVQICILEPNGSFYVRGKSPSSDELQRREILDALGRLTAELEALRLRSGQSG